MYIFTVYVTSVEPRGYSCPRNSLSLQRSVGSKCAMPLSSAGRLGFILRESLLTGLFGVGQWLLFSVWKFYCLYCFFSVLASVGSMALEACSLQNPRCFTLVFLCLMLHTCPLSTRQTLSWETGGGIPVITAVLWETGGRSPLQLGCSRQDSNQD